MASYHDAFKKGHIRKQDVCSIEWLCSSTIMASIQEETSSDFKKWLRGTTSSDFERIDFKQGTNYGTLY